MEDLIKEYQESLKKLNKIKDAPPGFTGMRQDLEWTIEYMKTGNPPGTDLLFARYSMQERKDLERRMAKAGLTNKQKKVYRLIRLRHETFQHAAELLNSYKGNIRRHLKSAEKKLLKTGH